MRISDLEQMLENWREQFGDIEIEEAHPSYGWKPFTEASLKSFLRMESVSKNGKVMEQHLTIGRH